MISPDLMVKMFLEKTIYRFEFDLMTGIVDEDIITNDGHNITSELGLKSPCSFDDIVERVYSKEHLRICHVADNSINLLNQKNFIKAYEEGKKNLGRVIYIPKSDEYHRISYSIRFDEETKSPRVFVYAIDVTSDEKSRGIIYGELRKEKIEIDDIIDSAQIGVWHIYMFDGEKPRMKATPKMRELLGIDKRVLTEEEIFDLWYSRIKPSSLPSVKESIKDIKTKGFSENTYVWLHPTKGERYVRCGGTSYLVDGKGYVLRGYHSDVTEIVLAETKQKQLLAEALEEVQKQKKLLQDALDDFKEADYDRRRDFLTGLRNRQDMFELIQDVLSGKREQISSMFMMDIDNFKLLNDNYGHSYGDECLKRIGDALNSYSEDNEIYFYRYGGEEVLGICFSKEKAASTIAQELVALVPSLEIKRDDFAIGVVTISLGYTTDNHRYEKMIDKADTAMYRAKELGKNQAICYEDM